ncbi:MAG: PilZ domain-containing protein [Pseudomonadota bacterium]|jgi:hypothetical protein|nr:PilZ domain-containing protein [Pseudomonadota bacterium]HJO34691.1 PilZ domain-containing protein [Gammaproteobacteria bacterium]
MADDPGDDSDQRRSFRVDDVLPLAYRIRDSHLMDAAATAPTAAVPSSDPFDLTPALNRMRQDFVLLHAEAERVSPTVARYLQLLDHKVGLMLQTLLMQQLEREDQAGPRPVNIGADGVSFPVLESIAEGAFIELRLLLPDLASGLSLTGRVTRCEPQDDIHLLAVHFVGLQDYQRDLLVHHTLRRQRQLLRARRDTDTGSA